jgi:hypothetical protein
MLRRLFKVVFVVLFVFVLSTAASALSPEDALSARPEKSVYSVVRVDDLNGLLQNTFSPANIEMIASLANPEDAQGVRLVASFASQIPARSVIAAFGMTADKKPFMQIAASMPGSVRSKLDRVSDGSATAVELITLLLGDAGMMFAAAVTMEVHQGAKGPYYTLDGQAAFAAKDDLLLIASSPAELEASLGALEKKENRLTLKRRFDSPNYWQMHMHMHTIAALAEEAGDKDFGKPGAFAELFKAPLEFEAAFSSKPGSFRLSFAANILESVADSGRYKDMKPAIGANLFLAGGGRLLFAFSGPLAFKAADLATQPEILAGWNKLVKELEKINISERDMEDLLNGSFSVTFGSDATILGRRTLGGYVAFTGREGAAGKILGKMMDNEAFSQAVPMAPLKVDGWDSAFAVDPALVPVPLVLGVMKDTFFAGFVDSAALAKTPELPVEASQMLEDPLFGRGVIDTAAIWSWLRGEFADPDSLLSAHMAEDAPKDVLNTIMDAELAVPFVKVWSSELEETILECTVADVPEGKRLLPRLIEAGQSLASQGDEEDEE